MLPETPEEFAMSRARPVHPALCENLGYPLPGDQIGVVEGRQVLYEPSLMKLRPL